MLLSVINVTVHRVHYVNPFGIPLVFSGFILPTSFQTLVSEHYLRNICVIDYHGYVLFLWSLSRPYFLFRLSSPNFNTSNAKSGTNETGTDCHFGAFEFISVFQWVCLTHLSSKSCTSTYSHGLCIIDYQGYVPFFVATIPSSFPLS